MRVTWTVWRVMLTAQLCHLFTFRTLIWSPSCESLLLRFWISFEFMSSRSCLGHGIFDHFLSPPLPSSLLPAPHLSSFSRRFPSLPDLAVRLAGAPTNPAQTSSGPTRWRKLLSALVPQCRPPPHPPLTPLPPSPPSPRTHRPLRTCGTRLNPWSRSPKPKRSRRSWTSAGRSGGASRDFRNPRPSDFASVRPQTADLIQNRSFFVTSPRYRPCYSDFCRPAFQGQMTEAKL